MDRIDPVFTGIHSLLGLRDCDSNQMILRYTLLYQKWQDASRVYGLELEHLLSQIASVNLVTRIRWSKRHIAGIPGLIKFWKKHNEPASYQCQSVWQKSFVEFNERVSSALGRYAFFPILVIDVTPDFEETPLSNRASWTWPANLMKGKNHLPPSISRKIITVQFGNEALTPEVYEAIPEEERTLIG